MRICYKNILQTGIQTTHLLGCWLVSAKLLLDNHWWLVWLANITSLKLSIRDICRQASQLQQVETHSPSKYCKTLPNIDKHRLHVWTPPWQARNRPSIKQIKPIFYTLPIWKFWAIVAVWAHPAVPPADTGTMHREYNNATSSIGLGETVGEERAGILILLSKCWSWKCSFHRYWNFSPPL